ncbi:MAG: FAD-dependent oxidoreductase [Methanobacteriota archaeon]
MGEDLDCIVIGAGVTGSAAAIKLAKEGASVLLVDRAAPIGAKNLSGGVLWGHELDKILPGWYKEAPIERPMTNKKISFLTKESNFTIDFKNEEWAREPYNGFMVLRARFDKWLAEMAQKAGAMVVEGVNVERLAFEGGKCVGVVQMGETVRANSVIVADGCNSRTLVNSGLKRREEPHEVVLGVKEVIHLGEDVIQSRFNLGKNQGMANEYVLGFLQNGVMAGGFLYTNRDTLSLGVVINLESMWEKGVFSRDIIEEFRLHPSVAPLLEGGTIVEYGAHLIPEWGVAEMPPLFGEGYCVAGDAAGFVFSNGMVIQGMNYGIASGIMAAETILEARDAKDFSAKRLKRYKWRLENSYVLKDFKKFKNMTKVVWNPRMFTKYAATIEGVFTDLITERGEPKQPTRKIAARQVKKNKIKPWELLADAITGARNL